MRVLAEGVLPADAATAWRYLTRWDRQSDWMADADEVAVIGARREGVGARVTVRTLVLSLPLFTDVLEVLRWEPPRVLVVAHTGFVRGAGEWRLDPVSDGATRFTWTENVRLPIPVLGPVVLRVYSVFMRRLMRRSISALARELLRAA